MWQILHRSYLKFIKLSNSGISLNWSTTDEVTTHNTTAYFMAHSIYSAGDHDVTLRYNFSNPK